MRRVWHSQSRQSLQLRPPYSRHSSNVPGPLEARRRSTKRKFAGAAAPQIDNAANEAGLLLSLRPMGYREPETSHNVPTELLGDIHDQPSWPITARKCIDWPATILGSPVWRSILDRPQAVAAHTSLRWQAGLGSCQNLQDIRDLAVNCRISLQDSEHSGLAFQQLCRLQPELSMVLEFLADRSINPPSAKNICFLVENIYTILGLEQRTKRWIREHTLMLTDWLGQEAALGALTEEELRELLRLCSWSGPGCYPMVNGLRTKITHELCVGLCNSKIRPIHQLRPATIRCIIRSLASPSYMSARELHSGLVSTVSRALHKGERCHVYQAERQYRISHAWLFVRTYLCRARDTSLFKRAYQDLLLILGRQRTALMPLLVDRFWSSKGEGAMHYQWLRHCLAEAYTQSLITKDVWMHYEGQLTDSRQLRLAATKPPASSAYIRNAEPRKVCEYMMEEWLLPNAACIFQPGLKISGTECESMAELRSIAMDSLQQGDANPRRIAHMALLDVADQISPILASELANCLLVSFNHPSTDASLAILARHCHHLQLRVSRTIAEKVVNRLALRHSDLALRYFMDDGRLRLERCLPLLASVIASPSIPTETMVPLLSRQGYFQGKQPKISSTPRNLAFIHSVATMLSKSNSSSTSRLALISRVFDMFPDLPVVYTENMRRTLLRGEVILPLQRGERIGPESLRKVLSHIAGTEGGTVAKKLETLLSLWDTRQASEDLNDWEPFQ